MNTKIIEDAMKNGIKRIGLMTGGGDCPGLNAVIRSVVLTAKQYGVEVIGIPYGYRGMFLGEDYFRLLTSKDVENIIDLGGTILFSSNKDNLFKYPRRDKNGLQKDENGKLIYDDFSELAVQNIKDANIDALIILGGDGTLTSGRDYSRMGVPVVGVPKTIDNDLKSTEITFGFDTAVARCVAAVDSIKTSGTAHSRVMFVEVMGRNAGHIALNTALATGADICLMAEIDYDPAVLVEDIRKTLKEKASAMIIVSEGVAAPQNTASTIKIVEGSPDAVRFSGIGAALADYTEKELNSTRDENGYAISETIIDVECRATVVGYSQRGGTPTANDRVLSSRLGSRAVIELMEHFKVDEKGNFGRMVAVRDNELTTVSLEDVIKDGSMIDNQRRVDVDGELVTLARNIGLSFADK